MASSEVPSVMMGESERAEKEAFRHSLEKVIIELCDNEPERLPRVSLESFGSFRSGFANAGSDMDLVVVLQDGTPYTACFSLLEDDLPRLLEKRLLQLGYGARLLTRTRVPIIKICEKPDEGLLDKLREEREKWDALPIDEKYPHLHAEEDAVEEESPTAGADDAKADHKPQTERTSKPSVEKYTALLPAGADGGNQDAPVSINGQATKQLPARPHRSGNPKPWTRERKAGLLDFPKSGIGIQSDINFFNPLGLHNTQLLRCYSLCDQRVRPMVLFVKSWAKRRKINSSYSGTLSSYGYVMMVLHYLVNVAQPPVLPNLQAPWRPNRSCTPPGASTTEVDGWIVDFWRNEDEILGAVRNGQLSQNRESLGSLLLGFFEYYSSQGYGPRFQWMQDVLSLRSPGGLLGKAEKGWVKAITEEGEGKKVQHRYLFCIEDPFELSHNVARTVTHQGIVAIRDEFRRARRILLAVGHGQDPPDGHLLDALVESEIPEDSRAASDNKATHSDNAVNGSVHDITQKLDAMKLHNKGTVGQNKRNHSNGLRPTAPPSQPLNLADNEAFPALGGRFGKANGNGKVQKANVSEISGDRAKAYLEEVKRKKADADAERTATGAAEAVLGDD
ncbi:hypothetical protein BAUCODRAFT_77162 [Baudoinia panamericana UAMH 10762]|uniref:polynucleotide adenylyltransferase n=1 Tax=Baudoinia panamericana (strain UAMH 10762) TaxID=717646 RepID=M2MNC3_BAUPA|nr:uncharacterized protein BAUCODRAFT_77162 [Baudoinia panamericana UAMH 10762]EMC92943.1 hypothetical protein BAUCODRAFT_77162 [Baudoinia panamericana UAMH 10762]